MLYCGRVQVAMGTMMNAIPLEFLVLLIILVCGISLIVIIMKSSADGSGTKNTTGNARYNRLVSELAANLIVADGKIATREVDAAIEIGKTIVPNFDETALKTYCYGSKKPRDHRRVAKEFGRLINQDEKRRVVDYLVAIATADNEIRTSEAELISEICHVWNIKMNG